MSEQVERRLIELLGSPTESPYGNPIPGLDLIGGEPGRDFDEGVIGLVKALDAQGGPLQGTVRRLAEPAQVDPELLQQLRVAGVVPGASGDFRYSEGYVLVHMDGSDEALELPVEIASHVFLVAPR
jgi:DtxR family Mn-dependent transcriptional regulator